MNSTRGQREGKKDNVSESGERCNSLLALRVMQHYHTVSVAVPLLTKDSDPHPPAVALAGESILD